MFDAEESDQQRCGRRMMFQDVTGKELCGCMRGKLREQEMGKVVSGQGGQQIK